MRALNTTRSGSTTPGIHEVRIRGNAFAFSIHGAASAPPIPAAVILRNCLRLSGITKKKICEVRGSDCIVGKTEGSPPHRHAGIVYQSTVNGVEYSVRCQRGDDNPQRFLEACQRCDNECQSKNSLIEER